MAQVLEYIPIRLMLLCSFDVTVCLLLFGQVENVRWRVFIQMFYHNEELILEGRRNTYKRELRKDAKHQRCLLRINGRLAETEL